MTKSFNGAITVPEESTLCISPTFGPKLGFRRGEDFQGENLREKRLIRDDFSQPASQTAMLGGNTLLLLIIWNRGRECQFRSRNPGPQRGKSAPQFPQGVGGSPSFEFAVCFSADFCLRAGKTLGVNSPVAAWEIRRESVG